VVIEAQEAVFLTAILQAGWRHLPARLRKKVDGPGRAEAAARPKKGMRNVGGRGEGGVAATSTVASSRRMWRRMLMEQGGEVVVVSVATRG
jgi:hypothetical protein